MDKYPKFRDIHPIPYEQDGNPAFMLRDPLQLNGNMLIIPEAIAPLVYIADGTKDISVLSTILDFHYGVKVSEGELTDIFSVFDEACLLDNPRSNEAYTEALTQYLSTNYREPASAGGSYPSDAASLSNLLNEYLDEAETSPAEPGIRGILSPHIDFARGGETYAKVWKRASSSLKDAELIVIIGTDHYGDNKEITLTRQNYATPFGILPTDQDAVDKLATALGVDDAFNGELFHKSEHSIELPLVWLQHFLGDRQIPVVPILCGSIDPEDSKFQSFVEALTDLTRDRKTFVVISGDLAHVGPAFGGDPVDSDGKHNISEIDVKLLGHLKEGDSAAFLDDILKIDNANNVCGTYPLYVALKAFDFSNGELNGYQQCPADDDGTSIVSVGGIVFR